jgi:AraC family transcriptional regulator
MGWRPPIVRAAGCIALPNRPSAGKEIAMTITRRSLFESEALQIGLFEARPSSDACGELEWQEANVVALPFRGVFSKHDAPGQSVIGTPSHAVFIAADTPYRLSFPGAIGDRALILRFGDALAPEHLGRRGGASLAPHGLLPSNAIMLRNLLWARLRNGDADRFETEAFGLDLLSVSLNALRGRDLALRASALARRMRAVARVQEAVAVAPSRKWSVAELGRIAHLSPFHLCRVFRQVTGTSIYDYVLRERLAQTLAAVLDGGDDITAIALDAGFASHSHFTARFKSFFNCTPAAFRRLATAERAAQSRKIMTAPRSRSAVE